MCAASLSLVLFEYAVDVNGRRPAEMWRVQILSTSSERNHIIEAGGNQDREQRILKKEMRRWSKMCILTPCCGHPEEQRMENRMNGESDHEPD